MAVTIKTKNSVVTTVTPSTLSQGELAINVPDKKLWVGDASSNPVQVLGAGAPVAGSSLTITGTSTLATSLSGIAKLTSGVVSAVAAPTGAIVGTTDTQTLTNKRITPRVLASTANSATPTLNTDNYDMMVITGQSVAITSFTTNLTGTPTNGQKLWISITGTTAIALTWGASFEASTVPLPTTTTSTNRLDVGFVWNVATSKWRCVAAS